MMGAKIALTELPGWPAALNQRLAVAYCGVSVDTFTSVCPVQPISITKSKTGKRYLRVRLDEWLMGMDASLPAGKLGVGERLREGHRRRSMGNVRGKNSEKASSE